MELKKILPNVQENISLRSYTTFEIGGNARYFLTAEETDEIIKGVKIAKEFGLPLFILGKGSNLLISDKGFDGLVIKVANCEFEVNNLKVKVGAGMDLSSLVTKLIDVELSGLEWAAGIPGTVGGAIRGNAGAFGSSIKDFAERVGVLDSNLEIKDYFLEDCNFNYRESVFKNNKNLIILEVVFRLERGEKKEIEKKVKDCLDFRREKHPLSFPSAGSVFKNPENISAGELIEKSGLKGKKVGKAQVSEKHTNFIINLGGATAENVLELINLIKKEVKEKFKIELEEEIKFLGF